MDYTKYIGIPFKYGGRTYKNLDCYGLVMLLYKELHGIDLPDVTSPEFLPAIATLIESEKLKWTPAPIEPGTVLIFNISGYGSHVAYVIGEDKMIHTWEKTGGVTVERISIYWQHRILGSYKYGT
jgi:cell wall-associated NlpC family hydrolase